MVRTRVIQTLFAYYKDGEKTPITAQKELLKSFAATYDLYVLLLDFVNELTAYAEVQIEQAESRAKVTHQPYSPNRRFVKNRLAQQLFENRAIRRHMESEHLSWESGSNAISTIYKALLESTFYQEYMSAEECTYEDDKRLWRKIYATLIANNDTFCEALEEMEVVLDRVNWTTDLDVVLSYIPKTLKRFELDSTPDTELLAMFDHEDELTFAKDLLRHTIEGHEQYEQLINSHLKNWDADRIAYMDRILLETALAEIMCFPDIALEVSFNEYIELGKEYSGEKSYLFINGILNEIMHDMKRDNSLIKAIHVK